MFKIILVLLLSFLASFGTLIYGYHFAEYYFQDPKLQIPIGIFLAITGAGANIILGAFSLFRINHGPVKYPYSMLILIVCIFSAIPMGCICYFGYQSIIPKQINLLMSFIVAIVNTAINYTAIQYFIKDILSASSDKNKVAANKLKNIIIGGIGYLIGCLVALAPFLAATAGANDIILHYKFYNLYKNNAGIIIGVLSFIPLACLYGHTNKAILSKLFDFMKRALRRGVKFNLFAIAILAFCFFSGAALAQIMREFLSPDKNIPALFKTEFMQSISNFLILLAWLSSTGTTFYCISDLLKNKLRG